jgi:hypothetical protein
LMCCVKCIIVDDCVCMHVCVCAVLQEADKSVFARLASSAKMRSEARLKAAATTEMWVMVEKRLLRVCVSVCARVVFACYV